MDEGPTEFEAMTQMLWSPPRLRTRGPKPAHSAEAVVAAGIKIADAEGLAAVTMQRVGQQLGLTKMALYRYVPSRKALVAAMTDRAFGLPPTIDVQSGWRHGLWLWAMAAYNIYLTHPWTLEATLGPHVIGPVEAAWTEAGLTVLASTPLSGAERLDVLVVTIGHARAIAEQFVGSEGGAASGASAELHFIEGVKRNVGRYPEFARATAEVESKGSAGNGLEFGLNCIFDGVALRIERQSP